MEQTDKYTKCHTGEHAGAGVYLCQTCNYAVVGVEDSYTIPSCPCCEGMLFTSCEESKHEL
ncbi:hypothetical protein L3Q72_17095 [Vibrio sp. JC009]|uniref:hypothetical protein n=1 Tax=Vibrio sp. JC009 TaxID=2912314 RepID=UPI0023B1D47A|nr:hypothetical protein [Vibrio sp. JC009]WED24591.1 hypothetical protein L3Q72_17095 [Vibrio sp. JC009]